MRLLLVGAFQFPLAQGSQVYFREQARALRDAGATVELLTYGAARETPHAEPEPPGWRTHALPGWTTPPSARSGPRLRKPLADAALAWRLRQLLGRGRAGAPFDAVLAHHAEAMVAAWLATRGRAEPVIYCAHTLLGEELSSYPGFRRAIFDTLGGRLDESLARRADGWIALSRTAAEVLRGASLRPGARIGPPLADPRAEPRAGAESPAPCLPAHPYFLYSGNDDPYQEIDTLFAAGVRLAERPAAPRIVVASHDAAAAARFEGRPGLVFRHVAQPEAMRTWIAGALALLVPRRRPGGFPIKLLNGLAAGVPALAWHAGEWGLHHGEDVWCVRRNGGGASADAPSDFAEAVDRLSRDEALCLRLGRGARARYERAHRPDAVARETLGLLERVCKAAAERGATLPAAAEAPLPR